MPKPLPGAKHELEASPAVKAAGWQDEMRSLAERQVRRATVNERYRNPMIPDDFLDTRDSGLPNDMMVKAVQIPRPGIPAEVAQYERFAKNFQHVKWDWVTKNGGADGKANIPGAHRVELGGGGEPVAAVAGCYLMFINRAYYEERRGINREHRNGILQSKVEERTEKTELGADRSVHVDRVNIESFEHLQQVENDPSERERKGN